jgi:hypothetical protein
VAPDAAALDDFVEAASTASNDAPFCRYLTLVAVGVVPVMNVTQFFAMVAAAPVNVDEGDADAVGEAGAEVVAAAAGDDVVAEAEGATVLLELLEQAVKAAASARPSAGTSRLRRAVILVRIFRDASLDGCK